MPFLLVLKILMRTPALGKVANMKIITAKVETIEKHPDAKKLKVCHISDGAQNYQVVCGAANVREKMVTIFAKVGSTLPNGNTIKEASLRGVDSYGMLCSPLDLGVREERGLVDLPETTNLGVEYTSLENDLLSSTPWHQYDHVDTHWLIGEKIQITRGKKINEAPQASAKLVSKTYYDGENYQYRSFNEAF